MIHIPPEICDYILSYLPEKRCVPRRRKRCWGHTNRCRVCKKRARYDVHLFCARHASKHSIALTRSGLHFLAHKLPTVDVFDSQTLDSQTLDSQTLDSQTLDSQTTHSGLNNNS